MRLNLISLLVVLASGSFSYACARRGIYPSPKPQPSDLDTDPALVGWWRFDEIAGPQAFDSSHQCHHGRLEGGLSFGKDSVPGRIGKALRFDGADGLIRITGGKGIAGKQACTMAAWIKTTVPEGEIISWGAEDYGPMGRLGFIRSSLAVGPRGGYLGMKTPVHDDCWHHVAAVVMDADPTHLDDRARLYRDGRLAEIDEMGPRDPSPIQAGSTVEVRIGGRFKGLINEVRLYNRALSEAEVRALFNLGTLRLEVRTNPTSCRS